MGYTNTVKPQAQKKPIAQSMSSTPKDTFKVTVINNINVNVFFDGTLNNKFNIDLRKQRKAISDQESYFNDYSNVAYMFRCRPKDNKIWIYIEGMGSTKGAKDDRQGFAFGSGKSGITARVDYAFSQIVSEIIAKSKGNPVQQVTCNVFGFSRGAASARHFVHVAKTQTSKRFGRLKMNANNIVFKFIGIYDTVSSFEELNEKEQALLNGKDPFDVGQAIGEIVKMRVGKNLLNDVDDLGLDFRSLSSTDKQITKVLHIRAMDEYRYFFPITDINSAIKQNFGIEVLINGAHSDIGGGYLPTTNDEYDVKNNSKLHNWLMKEGYHKSDQFAKISEYKDPRGEGIGYTIQRGTRHGIKNDIHRITLKIMRKVAEIQGNIKFTDEIKKVETSHQTFINQVMGHLPDLVKQSCQATKWGRTIDCQIGDTSVLHTLRNQYIHWSAKETFNPVADMGYQIRLEDEVPKRGVNATETDNK